jgi:23S rRNA pseudouridine1911/1915/1917 synthase
MIESSKLVQIEPQDEGKRIDTFLADKFPDHSRSYFQKLIISGKVLLNRMSTKPRIILKEGDRIQVIFAEQKLESLPKPEKMPLDIIYEDANVIIINKPAGIVVHPAAGNESGTIVNALIQRFPEITEAISSNELLARQRPGLVHRLDKDTSGVLVAAKNSRTMHSISRQIQHRDIKKIYMAICLGWPKENSGRLINYLGRDKKNRQKMTEVGADRGKEAISEYRVVDHFLGPDNAKISLIEFDIKTGRTHQIRVQSSTIGYPIIGDIIYGNKISLNISKTLQAKRQMLHAKAISFCLPGATKQSTFESPIPIDFDSILAQLNPA